MTKLTKIIFASVLFLTTGLAVGVYVLYAPAPEQPRGAVSTHTLQIGGMTRHYLVHQPLKDRGGAAVLLVFHSSRSSAEEMRNVVGQTLETLADRDNVVVVYPDGFEGHFNDCRKAASYSARTQNIDDVGFARGIVDKLSADGWIDGSRVYAIGYSNGGHMALRLALESAATVQGAVSIAGNLPSSDNLDCKVTTVVSPRIGFINGTDDPINPYQGGKVTLFGFGNRGSVLSARASAEWFAQRLALTGSNTHELPGDGTLVRREDWEGHSSHVMLISIDGGGHTIPQATYRFPRILGLTWQRNLALEAAWEMFFRAPK